jgi:hypothetical protein
MHARTEAIRLKIKRAKHHIANLDATIHRFFTDPPNPYPRVREVDPETGDLVIKLGKCKPIPDDLPLIIGDSIQNLRTALDHLVWQLVLSNGGTPDKSTSFPISEKGAEHYKSIAPGKVKGVAPEAVKLIDALKPYPGGNEPLVDLHALNITDKHRLLLICGAAHIGTSMRMELSVTPQTFFMPVPLPYNVTYPLKEGTEIYRIPRSTEGKFDENPEFTFQIAFGDAEIMKSGDTIVPPLHQLADFIDPIVGHFDRFMK